LVYHDELDNTYSDYKADVKTTLTVGDTRNNFQKWWEVQMAMITAMRDIEFRFTFADEPPASGGFIRLVNQQLLDSFGDLVGIVQYGMQFLNKTIGSPSGLALFNGTGTLFDKFIASEIDNDNVFYITNIWWREKGSGGAWTDFGQPTRAHLATLQRFVEVGDDLETTLGGTLGFWDGSYHIFNYTDKTGLTFSLCKALGSEIYEKFFDEEGVNATVDWMYETAEGDYKYGTDAYWTTHGYPEGRKYRVWKDFFRVDFLWGAGVSFVIYLIRKAKLGAFITKTVAKQLSKKLGKIGLAVDIDAIIDLLQSDAENQRSFKSINQLMTRLLYVVNKFEAAYSPQKGVMRF
jgi:hypothetical protein